MATLELSSPPKITTRKISLGYVVDRGNKGRETITVSGDVDPDTPFLPVHKRDAVSLCTIWDACTAYVGQQTSAAYKVYNADLKRWRSNMEMAVAENNGPSVLVLLRNKPVKPDLPDAVADQIAPYLAFLATVRGAWAGARKHTLAVHGSGKLKGQIIWTGTLSSLTRTSPANGVIAKGRKVV